MPKARAKCKCLTRWAPTLTPTALCTPCPVILKPTGAWGKSGISVYRKNYEIGFPYLSGLILLNDVKTGFPICVMNCTHVTGMRTGAVNGLFCRHLANKDAKVAGVIGCGFEGRTNLEAVLAELPGIQQVYAWAPRMPKVLDYCKQMSEKFSIPVVPVEHCEDCVRQADVLIIAGPGGHGDEHRIIAHDWIKPGCTILPVNQDSHFLRGVLASAMDKIFIDDHSSFDYLKGKGHYEGIAPYPPRLEDLLNNKAPGRESHEEIIIALHMGIALADIAPAWVVMERALQEGIGTLLPL